MSVKYEHNIKIFEFKVILRVLSCHKLLINARFDFFMFFFYNLRLKKTIHKKLYVVTSKKIFKTYNS